MDNFKEYLRKKMVWLKHNPHFIPLLLIFLSCIIYTFNLSLHSSACVFVEPAYIAFNIFVITLLSMLSIFSYLNSFSKKGLTKTISLVVVYVLLALQILLNIFNLDVLFNKFVQGIDQTKKNTLNESAAWIIIHIAFLSLSIIAIITKPYYHKLLLKVNTAPKSQEQYKQATKLEVLVEDEDEFGVKTVNQEIEQGENKTENINTDEKTD